MSNIDSKIQQEELRFEKILKESSDDGVRSQSILETARKIIEHCLFKKYIETANVDLDYSYTVFSATVRPEAYSGHLGNDFRKIINVYSALDVFAHESMDEEASKALLYDFYPRFIFVRRCVYDAWKIPMFFGLETAMPKLDKQDDDFYRLIAKTIDEQKPIGWVENEANVYTIIKEKPFFVDGETYYELVLDKCYSQLRRGDCFVAFTKTYVTQRYSSYFTFIDNVQSLNGYKMPFKTVATIGIHIRGIELKRFGDIVGVKIPQNITGNREYSIMMNYLHEFDLSLSDLALLSENQFDDFINKSGIVSASTDYFISLLLASRKIILEDVPGKNILLLLLSTMNNRLIRDQINWNFDRFENRWEVRPNQEASGLCIKNKSLPFDLMPYASYPAGHSISIDMLYDLIPLKGREHELLANFVESATDDKGILYVPVNSIPSGHDVDLEINTFNAKLNNSQKESRKMIRIDDYLFIKGYEETAEKIIAQLKEYTKLKEPNFSAYIDGELRKTHLNLSFFAEDKLTLLRSLFCNSRVAFVDGAAGTGKSVFISLVVSVMNNLNPIVLSKTNASAENLKQKIGNFSQSILTLDTFFKIYGSFHSSLCVVDECSTISNDDMIKLLDILNANNTFLLLVGDEHQIESIHFGNWFVLAKKGFSGNCHTLEIIFRAKGKTELQKLWTSCRVDKEKEKVLTLLGHGDYTRPVSDFGFEKICEDDVILCLNYDGLYGINNINRIMQANNKGKSFRFRDSEFRIGDPVIFSKSRRLEPFVYNGMHGTIKDINIVDGGLSFDIAVLSSMSIPVGSEKNQGFEYLGDKGSGIPLIRIKVVEKWDQDGDLNDASLSYLPFEVAYAVSIHKAQGLEYKNVRIIVTDNVAELITPNIFYTAITRTTDQLKIYWSPSSALSITKRLTENNGYEKDIDIFKSKFHFLF